MTYTPMPSVPATPDAAWGQQVNDNMTYLFEERCALVGFYELQDVLTDDPTTLTYTGSLTATEDGLYLVTATIGSTSQPDGGTRRYVRTVANGSTEVAMRQGRSSLNGTFHSAVTDLVRLEVGDELDTIVYQDSGYTMSYYGRLTALLVAP